MDELLRNIWNAEETHDMAAPVTAPLQRQDSSLTLPRTLSNKTVEKVWRSLARDDPPQEGTGGGGQQAQRQSTLGEMTLEEFLVKAGVVMHNPAPALPPPSVPVKSAAAAFLGNFPGAEDAASGFALVGMGNPSFGNVLMPRSAGMAGGGAMAVQTTAMSPLDPGGRGNCDMSSPNELLPYAFQGMMSRGRRNGGGLGRVTERRQRRMIKNRDSAARSRARKQAYTMELEAEVQKLKEQNRELERKQEEMKESQNSEIPDTEGSIWTD